MNITDLIGTLGVAILLIAFFLNLRNIISKENKSYLLMNVIGAALACYASILLYYWPFIILEGCWVMVSMFELIKSFSKRV